MLSPREHIREWIFDRAQTLMSSREPNLVVEIDGEVHMNRWWWIPKNPILNIYVHQLLKSDTDRALHDHPSLLNLSFLLRGTYVEHTILAGGVHKRVVYKAGDLILRSGWKAHRLEINRPTYTLFIMLLDIRYWGFHLKSGWVDSRNYTEKEGRVSRKSKS